MSDKEEKQQIGKPLPVTRNEEAIGPKIGPPVDLSKEDITPITREKIKKVNAGKWSDLNASQLHVQLDTLNSRLAYARQIGHDDMIRQLLPGIVQLEEIIRQKSGDEIKLL